MLLAHCVSLKTKMTPPHAHMNTATPYTPGDPFASPGFAMAYSAQRQQMYMMTPAAGHTSGQHGAPLTPMQFNHPEMSGCPQPQLISVAQSSARQDAQHNVAPCTPGALAKTIYIVGAVLCCSSALTSNSRSMFFLTLAIHGLDSAFVVAARGPSSSEISPAGLISPSPPAKEQQEKEAAAETPQQRPTAGERVVQEDLQKVKREPLQQSPSANVVSGRRISSGCRPGPGALLYCPSRLVGELLKQPIETGSD